MFAFPFCEGGNRSAGGSDHRFEGARDGTIEGECREARDARVALVLRLLSVLRDRLVLALPIMSVSGPWHLQRGRGRKVLLLTWTADGIRFRPVAAANLATSLGLRLFLVIPPETQQEQ